MRGLRIADWRRAAAINGSSVRIRNCERFEDTVACELHQDCHARSVMRLSTVVVLVDAVRTVAPRDAAGAAALEVQAGREARLQHGAGHDDRRHGRPRAAIRMSTCTRKWI